MLVDGTVNSDFTTIVQVVRQEKETSHMTMSVLESQAPRQFRTSADPFERAVRTLELPAQTSTSDGSTPAQRTKARFVLLEKLIFGELTGEQKRYVFGAFEHAFREDDVAPPLLDAIRADAPTLDFSQKYYTAEAIQGQFAKAKSADGAQKRAIAEAKRRKRQDRDRQAALAKGGGSGGGRSNEGKKGKKK